MPTEILLAGAMLGALVLYAVLAGADFGGGVWDLLASGPRRAEQRSLIEKAIGPIWEANHVWLILVVVLLFAAFPPAFAAISIALHVPLLLFLMGVLFRGSAFTFRAYDLRGDAAQRRWGLVFSLASVSAPIVLGVLVGTIASGRVRVSGGVVESGFFAPWLAPFPILAGLFALALFAFLAATYLTCEAHTPDLADDFRFRALAAGVVAGLLAVVTFAASFDGAPLISAGLTERRWTWPFHAATATAALTAFWSLHRRKFAVARVAAASQVALVVIGWAASQYPYLLVPDLTLVDASSNPRTQHLVLVALVVGSAVLFPSLHVLYRVFKAKD